MYAKKFLITIIVCLNTSHLFTMNSSIGTFFTSLTSYATNFIRASLPEPKHQEESQFLPPAPPAYNDQYNILTEKKREKCLSDLSLDTPEKKLNQCEDSSITSSSNYKSYQTGPSEVADQEMQQIAKGSMLSRVYLYITDSINGIDTQVINELKTNKFDMHDYIQAMHRIDNAIQILVSKENSFDLKYLFELCAERKIKISDTGRNIALRFIKKCKQKEVEKTAQDFQNHLEKVRFFKDEERMLLVLHDKKDDVSDSEYDEDLLFGRAMIILNRVKGKEKRK